MKKLTRHDPILHAIDIEMEAQNARHLPRRYLGASAIGDPCARKLWYGFRWTSKREIEASGLRKINDGFAGEDIMIKRLRSVPDLELVTEDVDGQINVTDFGSHFQGNLDGVIKHASLGPDWCVWENKVVNDKKFDKLKKLVLEDEATALSKWDEVYYAQAQVYMGKLGMSRHYLTCSTPGCRDTTSVVTEFHQKDYDDLLDKAEQIIFSESPPVRMSSDPGWFACKWCDHHATCHGSKLPQVSCRTCAHSTPTGDGKWRCEKFECELSDDAQREACFSHRYHPRLVPGEAVERGEDDVITYRMRDGSTYIDKGK